jgi:ABC-type dipeptide/oligopeptide/nickel transport system permease subunit
MIASRAVRRFVAQRGACVGAVMVIVLIAIALVQPARKDPLRSDIDHGLSVQGAPLPPSADAPLGTDDLGRDVWSRVVAGAGTSIEIATVATVLALAFGLLVGLTAGYAGGWVDEVLMRLVDLVLAFPYLLLAILLGVMFRQSGLGSAGVIVTLSIVGWTTIARVVRGKAMIIARGDHVLAARSLGASPARIVLRHVLPNVAGVVVALAALGFAQNLLSEAVLSYLGLGPPPPAPTWGRMMFEARSYYRAAPWLTIAPGVAILWAVVGFNLLGEGLRDLLDPKERR